ncbi:hypothetical protein BRC83_00675 [Halobacteriales archaeon QS_1_68_17]|nr:MAG: hypothetical protein BRC83_00675 [Halobacteriales archaeon QS_1_68_17]
MEAERGLTVVAAAGNVEDDQSERVHYPTSDDRGPFLVPGTSFTAPVVTGLLASILGSLDGSPEPADVVAAARKSGVSLDGGDGKKFNARLCRAALL